MLRTGTVSVFAAVLAFTLAAMAGAQAATLTVKETAQRRAFITGLQVTAPAGDDRAFVVTQAGDIRIYNPASDSFDDTPFLTVGNLGSAFEEGLLGLAFAPDYAASGKFYVSYVDSAGQHQIDEYRVFADNPNLADPASRRNILTVAHPDDGIPNHYGGWIGFSPVDGQLYITTGDSDGFTDASQNNNNLLGSVLRINPCDSNCDVAGRNYNIPGDNPFIGAGGRDEIWANGLRNPFRASFDAESGAFFIGDVGEDRIEEINLGFAGANYGWIAFEGREEFMPDLVDLDVSDVTFALYEYMHGTNDFEGFSVVGGGVYRGAISEINGLYFFADTVTNQIWSFEFDLSSMTISNLIQWDIAFEGPITSTFSTFIENITSISFDALGNLYITTLFGSTFLVTAANLDGVVPLPAASILMLAGLAMLRRKTRRARKGCASGEA